MTESIYTPERSAKLVALNAPMGRVRRDHVAGLMTCSCGAPIGDSIDRLEHLINETAIAVAAHVREEILREQIYVTERVLRDHLGRWHSPTSEAVCGPECDWTFRGSLAGFLDAIRDHHVEEIHRLMKERV